jgi:hypothetical protein
VSHSVTFNPLSLADLFQLGAIEVYDFQGDAVLAISDGAGRRQIHLFENEVEGRIMFGLNLGADIEVTNAPVFIGTPGLIETSFAIGDKAWDFSSMLLKGNDETELWIFRNDASFPEPTLSFSRVAPGN